LNNKWKHIDETNLLISDNYRQIGNLIKGHVLTFFQDNGKSTLKFALLEITTLLDSNAIGEVYLYSNRRGSKANEIKESYNRVIEKVKDKFGDNGLSAHKEWYNRKTYIYVGHNELITENSENSVGVWCFDGDQQKEERRRKNYAFLNKEIKESIIIEYLNHYISLLSSELEFNQHQHYAVIVKPISLEYDDDFIPIGNLYLHFATLRPYSEDEYKAFINSFLNIYLISKGGIIIKEVELKTRQETFPRLDFEPTFDSHSISKEFFGKFRENFMQIISNEANKNDFLSKYKTLLVEVIELTKTKWEIFKPGFDKHRDFSKFSLILKLRKEAKNISTKNIAAKPTDKMVINYLLLRCLIICLYKVSGFAIDEIHSFFRQKGFVKTTADSSNTVYTYFSDKLFLFIKKPNEHCAYSDLSALDAEAFDMQLSKLERDFISAVDKAL
jgi:hypothetical protein